MARRGPQSRFTREQDNIIAYWIENGGFNNLNKSFQDLSQLDIFDGITSEQIFSRYYGYIRKNAQLFNIVSTESTGENNYKNNPAYWRRAS